MSLETKKSPDHKKFESEDFLRLITNMLPAFVSYMDTERRYRFVNRVYGEWFGLPIDQIEGHSRAELLGAGDYDYVRPFEDMALSGRSVAFELTLKRPDGQYVNLDTEYLPDIDPMTKKVRGIIGVGQDVTARRQAHQESEVAKQKLHSLFLHAPMPIAVIEGRDLIFTLTNGPFEKLVGQDQLLGKKFRDEWCQLDTQGVFEIIDEVLTSGITFQRAEYPLVLDPRNPTHVRFFNLSCVPVLNLQNEIGGAMILAAEVTDQVEAKKKIQETQQRYQSLTDFLPNMMWSSDKSGRLNYANDRCLQYSGISTQEKFAQAWVATIYADDLKKVRAEWLHSVNTGETFNLECRLRRYDGAYRWFLGRAVAIKNSTGEVQYWIGTATDIDDSKRTSAELIAAKNSAENANRTKTAFLANMSHEIRTPLGAVLGFSELLKDAHLSAEDRDRYVETIARNGKALTKIIDDILDIAKVEAGRLEVEEIAFSFWGLLKEVVELFADGAKQKSIAMELKIDHDVPNWILSDPTRLRQILINIVGNAVKFTDNGSVEIRVRALEENTQNIWFSVDVKDSGRGVAVAQRARLFQPFSQADNSTTRRYGGTGLGLVLSRRLAEALGGTVILSEEPQAGGATFIFSFVAARASKESEVSTQVAELLPVRNAQASKNLSLENIRILLVDDSIDNQFLVKQMLVKLGALVDLAGNGKEALEIAFRKSHDIVLMDIQMPEMDGYQAIAALQAKSYPTPVVALTAHALVEERNRTKQAGFTAHLTKPIDKRDLLSTILNCKSKPTPDLSHS